MVYDTILALESKKEYLATYWHQGVCVGYGNSDTYSMKISVNQNELNFQRKQLIKEGIKAIK